LICIDELFIFFRHFRHVEILYLQHASLIPTIQEFLENLDNLYGAQKFTCYLERFVDESIDVLDIQILTDSDFEKLGISSIGVKTKLVREAKNYS
jgi:hypothetical protein